MSREPKTQLLLEAWSDGADVARDALIKRIEPELRQIAAARLRYERDCSLSTGDLVNELVLRIIKTERMDVQNRAHLMALCARMMRNVLIDHMRGKRSAKRGHHKVELATKIDGGQRFDLVSLESALVRLGVIDPQLLDLVELRFFGGMTISDVSQVTGVSEPTVIRRWRVARAWLSDALANPIDDA